MDDLDDTLRAAMQALDDRVPPGYFDDLAARVDARLQVPPTEEVMMSTQDRDPDRAAGASDDLNRTALGARSPAPPADAAAAAPGSSDSSGLHDIRALAKNTRQRVSRRITSQHDLDESLLASSTSGLRAMALPEPARLVSLPEVGDVKALLAQAHAAEASGAVATAVSAARPDGKRRGVPVWVYGGVFAAAAAALAVVMLKPGAGGPPAVAGQAPEARDQARDPRAAVGGEPAGAMPGSGAVAGASSAPAGSAPAGSAAAVTAPPPAPDADRLPEVASPVATAKPIVGSDNAPGARDASRDEHAVKADHGDKGRLDTAAHGDKGAAGGSGSGTSKKPDEKPPGDGKKPGEPKSLDDLISDAAGGPSAGAKPVEKPVIAKKELDSGDIRKGMGGVKGDAQSCYDKFSVTGTVGVKVTVAPSGQVQKAVATGSFAGTPTGDCVAAAAKGASFPAWDGPPMTISYSFLLSE